MKYEFLSFSSLPVVAWPVRRHLCQSFPRFLIASHDPWDMSSYRSRRFPVLLSSPRATAHFLSR